MGETYFEKLNEQTQTRFWINNPSGDDIRLALSHGAVSCTTNPAYCSRLLETDKEYIRSVIDAVVLEEPDIEQAAVVVYRQAAGRIMDAFAETHRKSGGAAGFVTIQDDPRKDEETDHTVAASLENRKLGPNYMTKIPVIRGGIQAIAGCVEENIPICATEIFSVSQAVRIAEVYTDACRRSGNAPPFYITHISGIFDEYLGKLAARTGIDIDPVVLRQAGLAVARKEFALLKRMGVKAHLLGGGARDTYHFTGLVGGDAHITINWSTAQEILDSGAPVERTIGAETPERVIGELREKFDDFRRAWDDDGLGTDDEFNSYGPVQLFRNAFLKGWYLLLAEVAARKAAKVL